ncbi:MAG: PorV/PorQ family protein [bacterium]|nr:PorV/PorQ family protein [bacterium]
MKFQLTILSIIVAFAFTNVELAKAQSVSKTGTTAGAFLQIPVGAQASGMGGAVAAHVNDASAMFWNPAGLADIESNELMVEYADWFVNINHNYFGVAIPTKKGVAGVNVVALTMGEFEETTYDNPEGTGRTFSAYMLSGGVSYAQYLFEGFRMGGNIKFVHEKIAETSATAFAFDVGTMYKLPFNDIRFGVAITNVGTQAQLDGDGLITPVDVADEIDGNYIADSKLATDAFNLPINLKVGFAGEVIDNDQLRATLSIDGNSPSDNVQSVSIGTEIAFLDDLFLIRAGLPYLGMEDRVQKYNFGVGINRGFNRNNLKMRFGYSLESYKYLNSVNRISLQILF